MSTATLAPTGTKEIAGFFFTNGETTAQKMAEIKRLTPEDKEQLAQGIRDGSLTY
jgi:hypothetical protein